MMKSWSHWLLVATLAWITACQTDESVTPLAEMDFRGARTDEKAVVGGIAENRKLGAVIRGADFEMWIDGLSIWPANLKSKQIVAIGTAELRHDLPVFTADTPEERGRMQGIPVPRGTDLHKASQRWVLRDAEWMSAKDYRATD